MKIKQNTIICIGMALVLMTIGTASAVTYNVTSIAGPQNYTTIQAAVNAANPGDTILVYPGTYNENLDVFTSSKNNLNITSTDGAAVTNVTAASSNDHVFHVTADGVTISGFNVTGATDLWNYGIYLDGVEGCTISDNKVSNNDDGIYLSSSSNNTLSNNTANSNDERGIWLWDSSNNLLSNNTANLNSGNGIELYDSTNNTLSSNTANSNNDFGIGLLYSDHNTLINNAANLNNFYGIDLLDSSYNTLTFNDALENDIGIPVSASSDNNTLMYNNASNGEYGIWLSASSNNTLSSNTANSNTNTGIYLTASSDNNILNNNIANSNIYRGISLWQSSNNTIYNNHFSNTINAYVSTDSTGNVWNTTKTAATNIVVGPYMGGNFWAEPNGTGFSQTCTDADGDGICDLPYTIGVNNTDYLPLSSEIPVAKPVITLLDPSSSSVSDNAGDSRTFTVIIDQIANVTWMLDWFTLYTNVSVQTASYHNSSAKVGVHNLTVIAQNDNGTDQKSWTWTVEQLIDTTEPVVIVNTPIDLWVNNGTVLYLNATITDVGSGVKNATVNVSGINDTINTAVLTNTADNYWTNDSIIVNTSNSGLQNLTITAYNNADNVNNSVGFTLKVDNILPVIQNAYATPSTIEANGIDDALLNVTATDADSNISSVSVNLSAIGGSPAQAMTNNNGTWQLIVNTTISGTFDLPVNVIDHAGNSNTSVSILLNASEVVSGIHLHQGWNFISVPYELRNSSVDSVLADVDYDDLAYYNTEMAIWENVSTIEPLKGYWIFVSEDSIIPQNVLDPKLPVLPQKIQLYEGWNSIGYTDSNQPLSAELTLRSIDDSYVSILGPWNPVKMSFEYVGHNGETGIISGKLVGTDVFEMEPYKGYWLYVTDECTLTIIGF
ncbi:NosD domain-containing protein [Methanococcoides methylutens]|uniref:NosD domain-containing protein n=1 Tax=Methanococcoides methylutens TaxID=2226 RepID=UPI004045053F